VTGVPIDVNRRVSKEFASLHTNYCKAKWLSVRFIVNAGAHFGIVRYDSNACVITEDDELNNFVPARREMERECERIW
jgi:hypothetical protein